MIGIQHYREFIELAHQLNYSHAADKLCMAQSALSKHISALENDLSVQLFDRNSQHVHLTEDGSTLLPLAEALVHADAQLHSVAHTIYLNNIQKNREYQLYIASFPLTAAYNITQTVARYCHLHRDITVHTSEFEPELIPRLLETHEFELAFVRGFREGMSDYDFIEYCKEDVISVLPANHPLATKKKIHLLDLKDEDMILIGKQAELHYICLTLCAKAGFQPKITFRGLHPENMIALVSLNMGVALQTRHFYDYYKQPNTVCVEIEPTAKTSIYLIKLKRRKLSPAAQSFWNYIANLHKENASGKGYFCIADE